MQAKDIHLHNAMAKPYFYRAIYRIVLMLALAILVTACDSRPDKQAANALPPTELTALQTQPPVYPVEAACNGGGGTSTLRVTIGTEGTPTEVTLITASGNTLLDEAAIAAVKQWKFKPATRQGQPVPQTINVPVNFPAPQVRPDVCFSLDEKITLPNK